MFKIKKCCYNCHSYDSDEGCNGLENLDDSCFEYNQSLYRDEKDESQWAIEE